MFPAIGIFLSFGAAMAFLAGSTLTWPGSFLDRIWVLNSQAYRQLAPLGRTVGILFLLLGVALAAATAGWFRRRRWGWLLAVGIIAAQVLGDLGNMIAGHLLEGAFGVVIAGALLLYLFRREVRVVFERRGSPAER